jgi:hypothetical protein
MIPKLIFIVPYRDREAQKNHFEVMMKYILEDIPKEDYAIYFVHQCDQRPFNRGAMKNIGFLAIKDLYPNDYKNIVFVFNDIDTTPCYKNLLDYYTSNGNVKHFYGFYITLGGIVSITGSDFEKCLGYPNLWGWGYEDTVFQTRVKKNNIKIDRSVFFKPYDHKINVLVDAPIRQLTRYNNNMVNAIMSGQIENNKLIDSLTGIINLNYIIQEEFINVSYFSVINTVDNIQHKTLVIESLEHNKYNNQSNNTKISRLMPNRINRHKSMGNMFKNNTK